MRRRMGGQPRPGLLQGWPVVAKATCKGVIGCSQPGLLARSQLGHKGWLLAGRPQGQRPPKASPQRGGAHCLLRGSGGDDAEREEEDLGYSF
ncbi:hypothetical protein BHE74_00047514 [Ensete ventricosum]|nr:hypothetical protein BHE74_00047514 [Ensete ventricosum]